AVIHIEAVHDAPVGSGIGHEAAPARLRAAHLAKCEGKAVRTQQDLMVLAVEVEPHEGVIKRATRCARLATKGSEHYQALGCERDREAERAQAELLGRPA